MEDGREDCSGNAIICETRRSMTLFTQAQSLPLHPLGTAAAGRRWQRGKLRGGRGRGSGLRFEEAVGLRSILQDNASLKSWCLLSRRCFVSIPSLGHNEACTAFSLSLSPEKLALPSVKETALKPHGADNVGPYGFDSSWSSHEEDFRMALVVWLSHIQLLNHPGGRPSPRLLKLCQAPEQSTPFPESRGIHAGIAT
ncbi:hypothetical protein BJ546DRAFT_66715 [Cryomyces antarcticus]